MSNLKFKVDSSGIAAVFGDMKEEVEKAVNVGVKALASMTHAKTMELAKAELGSTSKKYRQALSFQKVDTNVYVVSLDESMLWLEEGRKSGSMVDDLLREGAKYTKSGSRYKAIPFDYSASKPISDRAQFGRQITELLKAELKDRKIPYKGIEYDRNGKPKLGKLHTFDAAIHRNPIPSENANTPVLNGVNIYQRMRDDGKVERSITTFRIVTDKHAGSGKWVHPGIPPKKLMDVALGWAMNTWEMEILPNILSQFDKK